MELVNAGGSFGAISYEQILKKMNQVLKYIPGACEESMLILMDLLEIEPPRPYLLSASQPKWIAPDPRATPLVLEIPERAMQKRTGVR